MIVLDDLGVKHEGDNVLSSKEKKKQIREERRKNSLFAKVSKYFSYAVGFIIVVLIIRRLINKINLENGSVEPNEEKTK